MGPGPGAWRASPDTGRSADRGGSPDQSRALSVNESGPPCACGERGGKPSPPGLRGQVFDLTTDPLTPPSSIEKFPLKTGMAQRERGSEPG